MLRRRILQRMLCVPGIAQLTLRLASAQARRFPGDFDACFRALAPVVFPASLGEAVLDRTAERFIEWVRDYRAGAEKEHGYGITKIRFTGPHPAPKYLENLSSLERMAKERGAVSFASLDAGARKQITTTALREAGITKLPQTPEGAHLVADLLAFYFQSSEANDLCYNASIRSFDCRGFAHAGDRLRPLSKKGTPA